jgi:cupin fold WbuC family metalloprotein
MEHQMLIAMSRTGPYPAHCHPGKNEAVLPVLGEALHLTYRADGLVVSENHLGRGSNMYLSTLAGVWHSMNALTTWFVYWELASGPFDPSSTVQAPWVSD